MIEINGKIYRNIQEQVGENQENIEDLDTRVTALENEPSQTYTEGAGIDILNNVISVDNTIVPFKADLATVATTGSYNDLSNKPSIPDVSNYVVKSIDNEDTEYGINYGLSNNTPQLFGADNYGSHPCDARVKVSYNSVTINANDYNHGDNDDTYTGSIDVTDGYVDIEATDGEDTTTLRVAPSGVTVNGSPIGGGGSDETVIEVSGTINTSAATTVTLSAAQLASYKAAVLAHTPITFVLLTPGGPGAEDKRIYLRQGLYAYMGTGYINSDTAFYGFYYNTVVRLRYINDSTGVGYITTAALTFTSD